MRIGFFAIGIGRLTHPDWIRTVATNAERLGFASLWAPEHVVLLDSYASRYPYRDDGTLPAPADAPIPDPFLSLCTMASVTNRIRLATGICLVPEHNPLVLAKVVATLDSLSEGRVVLGVGVGWLEEEFRALGGLCECLHHRHPADPSRNDREKSDLHGAILLARGFSIRIFKPEPFKLTISPETLDYADFRITSGCSREVSQMMLHES